jgi:hypothetical protein
MLDRAVDPGTTFGPIALLQFYNRKSHAAGVGGMCVLKAAILRVSRVFQYSDSVVTTALARSLP